MKSAIKIFFLLLAVLTAVKAFYYLAAHRHSVGTADGDQVNVVDDSRESADESYATGKAGTTGGYVLKLSQDIQQQAGLRLTELISAQYRNEIHATGQVVDLQPLLDLRSRYHEIQGEQRIMDTALEVTRQEYERLQQLHQEAANISGRELQQAKLQWETRAAESRAATVKLDDLRHQFVQKWGAEITELFLGDADLFRDLSSRKSVLLLVTEVGDRRIDPAIRSVFINTLDHRESAQEADFISVAASTDDRTQGATYFFHTPVSTLRTGMNVDVWIPEAGEARPGVFVPSESVVWYTDKPWVYVARDQETFARVEVKQYVMTRQGWFVTEGFRPGDRIVTTGAQMLFSQEFRWSIPDEDANP